MYSYILLILSIIPILCRGNITGIKNNIYSLLLTSLLFSYTTLGLISLILVSLGKSRFPIIIISLTLFIITYLKDKNFINKYKKIKELLLLEIKNIILFSNDKNNNLFNFIIIIVFLLINVSSIGPINHPDALDYHIGYPYQYWLNGNLIIDGGIHQGLLGVGDYANISFIQENSIWLIRYIQIINLPIILIFLLRNKINKLSILIFLTSPVFIQWSTIGKPLFLGESSCAITYILWVSNKDSRLRDLLIVSIISCISIKISSLIVCLPIIVHMIYDFLNESKFSFNLSKKVLKKILFSKEIIVSIITLISILLSRQIIINNFAFPLFTGLFNKNNILITNFANEVTNYQRDGMFPLNIFLPVELSDLSSSLGPAILIIILLSLAKNINQIKLKNDGINNIAISQTILLILFCQGRGDYYCFPLILFIFSSRNLNIVKSNKYIKLLLSISFNFQLLLIICFLSISIYQNIQSINNLNRALSIHSYGYAPSKFIDKSTKGNVFYNITREPRFYFPKNYIAREKLDFCLLEKNKSQTKCIDQFNITQIISHPDYLQNKEGFSCQRKESLKGSRSIFNRKNISLEVCERD